jgi:peptide-methionine (S)-S-oxide reductase
MLTLGRTVASDCSRQRYLAHNGYCGFGGTGLSCPIGVAKADG